MARYLHSIPMDTLIELLVQAKIPHIHDLNRMDMISELEDDYYKAYEEALIELHEREHSRMTFSDSVCTCTCPICFNYSLDPPICKCPQCPCPPTGIMKDNPNNAG